MVSFGNSHLEWHQSENFDLSKKVISFNIYPAVAELQVWLELRFFAWIFVHPTYNVNSTPPKVFFYMCILEKSSGEPYCHFLNCPKYETHQKYEKEQI